MATYGPIGNPKLDRVVGFSARRAMHARVALSHPMAQSHPLVKHFLRKGVPSISAGGARPDPLARNADRRDQRDPTQTRDRPSVGVRPFQAFGDAAAKLYDERAKSLGGMQRTAPFQASGATYRG